MGTRQITVRLDERTAGKLDKQSARTGLSVNQIAGTLLTRALDEGWTVQPGGGPVAVPPPGTLTSSQGAGAKDG